MVLSDYLYWIILFHKQKNTDYIEAYAIENT